MVYLTNKKAIAVLFSVIKHARKKKVKRNTRLWLVFLPTSFVLLSLNSLHALQQNKARLWLFYLFYDI